MAMMVTTTGHAVRGVVLCCLPAVGKLWQNQASPELGWDCGANQRF